MKIPILAIIAGVALPFSIFADSDPPEKMITDANSLGAVTYTEWVDGAEKEITNPKPGTRIKGDIGVLRGNGKQTTQRVYWTNKAMAIVSDTPSEAELTPKLWRTWEFGQK